MQVIEFIKQKGFQALTDELGIVVKHHPIGLTTLNYSQIDSPKTDPIVIECRSLILETETLKVVSRSFDRFFNLGEALNVMPTIDWANAEIFEKVDGSLIKIYCYKGTWLVATRSTVDANVECMGFGITFKELVYRALNVSSDLEFQELCWNSVMRPDTTYIFELTCVENRVVKHYTGYNMTFLGARTVNGVYVSNDERAWIYTEDIHDQKSIGSRSKDAKRFAFNCEQEAVHSAASLKDLDEGYIVYQNGVPVCKIKSPAYVAIHHIKGEGLNPKRMSQLVISGEVEEYLTYFETDRTILQPYIDAYGELVYLMQYVLDMLGEVEDQKEFALQAKNYNFSAVLFNARNKGILTIDSFNQQRDSYKIDLLSKYVD